MCAASHIVAGVFSGGQIENGTFHLGETLRSQATGKTAVVTASSKNADTTKVSPDQRVPDPSPVSASLSSQN